MPLGWLTQDAQEQIRLALPYDVLMLKRDQEDEFSFDSIYLIIPQNKEQEQLLYIVINDF